MTRLWQPPIPIRVWLMDDAPTRIIWDRHVLHVEKVVQHWRVRIWWQGIWREYYKLTMISEGGILLVVVYRNLPDNAWYLQEMFD